MTRAAPVLLAALALAGCPSDGSGPPDPLPTPPPPGQVAWTITADREEADEGWADTRVRVEETRSGAGVEGLEVLADVRMPSMGHGSSEDVTVAEEGDGVYVVSAYYLMAGRWELFGEARDGDRADEFVFEVRVYGGM